MLKNLPDNFFLERRLADSGEVLERVEIPLPEIIIKEHIKYLEEELLKNEREAKYSNNEAKIADAESNIAIIYQEIKRVEGMLND